ncbi:MAG: hypothetical protein F4X59_09830 [Holophagales bacterium]|nr:hypothetical protein [Holophagales bacterium]MYC10414.1 hypothetical protein [Holophagales bacterium]
MPAQRTKLDDLLKDTKKARLIPAYDQKQLEQRLTTVLLASMTVVRPLAKGLIKIWAGRNYGARSRLKAYTEVSFPRSGTESGSLRPDGVLVLTTGSQRWTALVEAKARGNPIDEEQVEAYVSVARDYGIDAVLTVSNQRAALPDHLPYPPPRNQPRGRSRVDVRHGSWASIGTEAALILNSEQDVDDEQRYILEELVAYFGHPKSGVLPFDQMNPEWPSVVDACRNGRPVSKAEREATVGAWHQEVRDICLILSERTHQRVDTFLPRKHKAGTEGARRRLEDDCASLSSLWELGCDIRIPNAASDVRLDVDFSARTIECSMALKSPRDRKTPKARINWLKMQLRNKTEDPGDVVVRAKWHGRVPDTQTTLAQIIDDAGSLLSNGSANLTSFVIIMQQELSGQFRSRKKFVARLEELVDDYYARVGQHLRAWQEPPPKVASRGETAVNQPAVGEMAGDSE